MGRSPPPRLSAGEGARRNGETRRRQQRSRAFTDQFLFAAPSGRQTARRVSASCRLNSSASKSCICWIRRSATEATTIRLFGDTGQVVIEGGAADDIFGGFDEIGGFINDARRIAGASADHFYRFSCPSPQCGAAGDSQNGNQRVGHHLLGGFKGRLGNGHHRVTDPAAAVGDLFDPAISFSETFSRRDGG